MIRCCGIFACCCLLLAGQALAGAIDRSPLPKPRPGGGGTVAAVAAAVPERPGQRAGIPLGSAAEAGSVAVTEPEASGPPTRSPLPKPRPGTDGDLAAGAAAAAAAAAPALALASTSAPALALASTAAAAIAPLQPGTEGAASPVPKPRRGLFSLLTASASRTQPDPGVIAGRAGSVCGIPGIKGRALPPIAARIKGCGVEAPVEVTSVDGIALSPAATLDCTTAQALNTWVQTAAKPAFDAKGGGLEALRVAASYICRTRNNVPGARISEHGRGRAIDISGFILTSGAEVTVASDYRRGSYSRPLQAVHKAACGPFGTTLGPGSDGAHEDHLHLDTARYNSGGYCR